MHLTSYSTVYTLHDPRTRVTAYIGYIASNVCSWGHNSKHNTRTPKSSFTNNLELLIENLLN